MVMRASSQHAPRRASLLMNVIWRNMRAFYMGRKRVNSPASIFFRGSRSYAVFWTCLVSKNDEKRFVCAKKTFTFSEQKKAPPSGRAFSGSLQTKIGEKTKPSATRYCLKKRRNATPISSKKNENEPA
jgi:hypothetical protein